MLMIIRYLSINPVRGFHHQSLHSMTSAYIRLFFILLCLLPQLSSADAQDDYSKGLQAYQQQDLLTAIDLLKSAADQGYTKAQSLLGYIYDKAEENGQALHYYKLAAERGDADGAYGMGNLYASGEGVEQDFIQAVMWYEIAADKGHVHAIDVLATAYLNGGLGLNKDSKKAIELLQRGAALDHPSSKQKLEAIGEMSGG